MALEDGLCGRGNAMFTVNVVLRRAHEHRASLDGESTCSVHAAATAVMRAFA